MTRRVFIAAARGAPGWDAQLLTLAGYAIVRGYDPIVVGPDVDAAAAIGAGGGEFWAIEQSPVAYTAEVAAAFREWERESVAFSVRLLRKSKTWPAWVVEMQQYRPAPALVTCDDDTPF